MDLNRLFKMETDVVTDRGSINYNWTQEDKKENSTTVCTSITGKREVAYSSSVFSDNNQSGPCETVIGQRQTIERQQTAVTYSAKVRNLSESSGSDTPIEESASDSSYQALSTSESKEDHHRKRQCEDSGLSEEQHMNVIHFKVTNHGDATGSYHGNCQSLAISDGYVEHEVSADYTGPHVLENNSFSESKDSIRGETNDFDKESKEGLGASLRGMKFLYTDYKDVDARLRTLNNWPKIRPPKEAIANAGLFSLGGIDEYDDTVVCFKCGEYLSHFEDDDVPQAEHDRIYPYCKSTNWY